VKTNRLDSKKLSEGLRGGNCAAFMCRRSYRELRHLVQLRDTEVAQLTATKCRIKSLLLYEGIPFPPPTVNGRGVYCGSWKRCLVAPQCALSWTT